MQISQTYLKIQNPLCRNYRYSKYHRIIQMRDSKPPSQILQISKISQISHIYCRNHRYYKFHKIIKLRLKTPIADIADIANIADVLQKSQILQISQNYPKERHNIPIAEITDIADILQNSQISQNYPKGRFSCIANFAELSKRHAESPSQNIACILQKVQILQISHTGIYRKNDRYCKYCRIIQMKDSKPRSQILQIS